MNKKSSQIGSERPPIQVFPHSAVLGGSVISGLDQALGTQTQSNRHPTGTAGNPPFWLKRPTLKHRISIHFALGSSSSSIMYHLCDFLSFSPLFDFL